MTRSDRLVTRLCLRILWDAVDSARHVTVQTDAVRLALRILLHYCPDQWPLTNFWQAAGTEQAIGRTQGISAAYRAILVQLDTAGMHPPAYSPLEAPGLD